MAKPDTPKTRHLRLTITKKLAPRVVVTVTYDDEKEIIKKLGTWGVLGDLSSDLVKVRQRIKGGRGKSVRLLDGAPDVGGAAAG